MFKKLLFGFGLFTLGYIVGKTVGRSEAEMGGHLDWEGDDSSRIIPDQPIEDAEFHESKSA